MKRERALYCLVSHFPQTDIKSEFIYRQDTVNYEKGDLRILKQSVNIQADSVYEEHRTEKVERETAHEGTQDE
jgi:hypothetical protein